MPVESMGKFTAIGMRTPAKNLPPDAIVVNTCGQNDTAEPGDDQTWTFCNPTNRAIRHKYHDIEAVSVECLWQGTNAPDPQTLNGDWRRGKAKAPRGAYAGPNQPLITNPGDARRAIYIPAFRNLIEHWLQDPTIAQRIERHRQSPHPVFLRDHDVGRGVDRNGPLSHAWVFCVWLNTGEWPS